jgi:hypothetical protein
MWERTGFKSRNSGTKICSKPRKPNIVLRNFCECCHSDPALQARNLSSETKGDPSSSANKNGALLGLTGGLLQHPAKAPARRADNMRGDNG